MRVGFKNPWYWSDLRADTGTLFFPEQIQTKQSNTVAQGREFVQCRRDVGGAFVDSWCE